MSHLEQLTNLLEPLGIYDFDSTFHRGELTAMATPLDAVLALVEELEGEMSLVTAEDWGLSQIGDLLSVQPVASTSAELAQAYAALLRVGGDSFTPTDINDTVKGCGVNALVVELDEPNHVRVEFPEVAGIPEGYEAIEKIINGILPAQLGVDYYFWYRSWSMIAELTWAEAEDGYSWYTLATGEK